MLELMNMGSLPATQLKTEWTNAATLILKASVPVRFNMTVDARDVSMRVFDQKGTSLYSFVETGTQIRTHSIAIPIGTTAVQIQTQPREGANISLTGSNISMQLNGSSFPTASRVTEIRDWGDSQLHRIAFPDHIELLKVPAELPAAVSRYNNSFSGCTNLNDPNISSWDLSKVVIAPAMFQLCQRFNRPVGHWNVSNIDQFTSMFRGCDDFNQPLNNWNVSKAVMMDNMFNLTPKFNQPLNLWNTANLQYMQNMFRGASIFNQNLSGWDVKKVVNRSNYDADCPMWLPANKPIFV